MKSIQFILVALLICFNLPVSASLNIHITNDTSSICRLIDYQRIHGILYSSPPRRILINDSKDFSVSGDLHGVHVVMNLDCGGKKISLSSQEDLGVFHQGDIHAEVLYADKGITAHPDPIIGDFIDFSELDWTLKDA